MLYFRFHIQAITELISSLVANRSNGNRVLTLGGRARSLLVLRMSKSAYTDSAYTYTASSLLWAG